MAADTRDKEEDVRAVLEGDPETARTFFQLVSHPADIVEALDEVDPEHWPRLLKLLPDEEIRADVVALMDEADTDALLEHLEPEDIAPIVREMETDDAADLIAELEPDEQREALAALDEDERADVEKLLRFPEDSAGGIMQTELASVNKSATVDDAVKVVRELAEDGISLHRVYAIDDKDRLVGSAPLMDLLLFDGATPLEKFLSPVIATATPLVDQEEVAQTFRKYDLVTLPVVDEEGRLLGRILHDDVVDVLEEEAEEDALRMAGTDVEELLYRDRVLPIARVRMPWIAVNLVGSLMCAFLLHLYEAVLTQAILLASFIPVITAMSGNVGTQSATILIQGLAKDRVDLSDVPRLLFKEWRIGLIMGLLSGIGVGVVASFLFGGVRPFLGLVVFISMLAAMSCATVIGALAPATMKRFGVDPAIAASPMVTTTNDIIGIVIYMSVAVLFLDRLN
jgi:magnesium transporter